MGGFSPASMGAEGGPISVEKKWKAEEKTAYEQHDFWYLIGNFVNPCKRIR